MLQMNIINQAMERYFYFQKKYSLDFISYILEDFWYKYGTTNSLSYSGKLRGNDHQLLQWPWLECLSWTHCTNDRRSTRSRKERNVTMRSQMIVFNSQSVSGIQQTVSSRQEVTESGDGFVDGPRTVV
ncbi:uncharacterized protein LOC117104605 [Anneissia japonica]|uniref:uncharacterized protein LOC117104605 n=1 Tax=Anneissia japonica TaxID=1529436 RepID=UPI001425A894|nr:uncharacterized protein LOC117104605 [Anneissia japonica]